MGGAVGPVEARELPADLARIDELLGDPGLLRPIAAHSWREVEQTGRAVLTEGRPTIAMETYVRLMVVKQRSGLGYEALCREVSDSLHLRRFLPDPLAWLSLLTSATPGTTTTTPFPPRPSTAS